MNELFKKAQEFQNNLKNETKELQKVKHTVTVGGDMIEVVVNGKQEILSIKLNPEIVDPNDIETLQELLRSAFNQAIIKSREGSMKNFQDILTNMNI